MTNVMTALQQKTWSKPAEKQSPGRKTHQQDLFLYHATNLGNVPPTSSPLLVTCAPAQAEMKNSPPEDLPDKLSPRNRKASYSEIHEPILAGFFKRNYSQEDQDDYETNASGEWASPVISNPLSASLSEDALAKADQLFTLDWASSSVKSRSVEVSDSWSAKEEDYTGGLEVKLPINNRPLRSINRVILSPTTDHDVSQMFDMGSVFQKVESMHSNAPFIGIVPDTAREMRLKTQLATKNLIREGKIKEVEGKLEESQNQLTIVRKELDIIKTEKMLVEKRAKATRMVLQEAIDELVADIVRLETESSEKNIMVAELWEEWQVAQEAAKHRRRMLTCLRQEHANELKLLQECKEEMQKTPKMHLRASSKNLTMSFLSEPDAESPYLPVLDETTELELEEPYSLDDPERSSKDALDELIMKIANITGERHGSPRGKEKTEGGQEDEEEEFLTVRKWSFKPQNPPPGPDNLSDSILAKLTGVSVPDEPFFKVTIEENTPRKGVAPRKISFGISEEEANSTLTTANSDEGEGANNISDLLTAFLSNASPNLAPESFGTDPCSSSQLSYIIEDSEENVQENLPTARFNHSPASRNRSKYRISRSRSPARKKHHQSRSWSAPPNKPVVMSILSALRRVSKAQADKQQVPRDKSSDRYRSRSLTDSLQRRRRRGISAGGRARTRSSARFESRKSNSRVNHPTSSESPNDKIHYSATNESYLSRKFNDQTHHVGSTGGERDQNSDIPPEEHVLLPSVVHFTRERNRSNGATIQIEEPPIQSKPNSTSTVGPSYDSTSNQRARNLNVPHQSSPSFSPPDRRMRESTTPRTAIRNIKGLSEADILIQSMDGDCDYISRNQYLEEFRSSKKLNVLGPKLSIIHEKETRRSSGGDSST